MSNGNGQSSLEQSIEALTHQVGRLTEGMTDIRNLVERVAVTTEQQAEISKTQAASVDRLTKIVEGLLENR